MDFAMLKFEIVEHQATKDGNCLKRGIRDLCLRIPHRHFLYCGPIQRSLTPRSDRMQYVSPDMMLSKDSWKEMRTRADASADDRHQPSMSSQTVVSWRAADSS